MIGFVNIVNGFSLAAIQSLQYMADTVYLGDNDGWRPIQLPEKAFDVTNAVDMAPHTPLVGDGVTDDSAALQAIANDTSITNLYFPNTHSFLLLDVHLGDHCKAVYGNGTTIISKASVPVDSPKGAFYSDFVTLTDFVLEGINFVQEDGSYPPNNDGTRWYGHFTMASGANMYNCELRKCTYDNLYFHNNGIEIMPGNQGAIVAGLRIYENTFTNGHEFPIELFNRDYSDPTGGNRSATNIRIYDNHFSGDDCRGISFVNIRGGVGNTGAPDGTESYIYNNTFDGSWWFLEIAGSGIVVHNNYGTGCGRNPISAGGRLDTPTGKNFFYDNHFETDSVDACIHLYNGVGDEHYNNYYKCRTFLENHSGYENEEWGLNMHDNTIVSTPPSAIQAVLQLRATSVNDCTFNNNEIYGGTNAPRGFHIADASSGGSTVIFTDNDQYLMQSGGTCIDDASNPVTKSGNTCDLGYTGDIPTSRTGAGLQ